MKATKILLVLASVLMFSGCLFEHEDKYTEVRIDPTVGERWIKAFVSADSAWQHALGSDYNFEVYVAPTSRDLCTRFVENGHECINVVMHGTKTENGFWGHAGCSGEICDIVLSNDVAHDAYDYVARHELGHHLGCWTHLEIGNVMCGDGRQCGLGNTTKPTVADVACTKKGPH